MANDEYEEGKAELRALVESAMAKLLRGFQDGPGGEDVVLTTAEATVVYRRLRGL